MRPVDITWAGGEHAFLLRIGELRALEVKCDAGPAEVLMRLGTSRWRVDDVIQTIRLGLEGGGLEKDEARRLTERFVETEPLTLSVETARAILLVSLFGPGDDPVGEAEAGEAAAGPRSRAGESGGRNISAPAPSSDSPRPMSAP